MDAAAPIQGRIDFGASRLARICAEAGLSRRQTLVVQFGCTGVDDETVADLLNRERLQPDEKKPRKPLTAETVRQTFRAAVRKLREKFETPGLDAEDRRAILRAIRQQSDRHEQRHEGGIRFDGWFGPNRVQGVVPFGMVQGDLNERRGPAGQLLPLVCALTGTPEPPLRLRTCEAAPRVKSVREGQDYVGVIV